MDAPPGLLFRVDSPDEEDLLGAGPQARLSPGAIQMIERLALQWCQ